MISRQYRFHGHNSLSRTYQRGQTVRSGSLALRYLLNPHRRTFRVAVVVSRKVSKSAIVRNRIRRRLYEIVRSYQDAITEPYDLVFVIFSDQPASLSAAQLDKIVHGELVKAGVIVSNVKPRHAIVGAKEP